MAKVHGSLSRAGKVKLQTPKVEVCSDTYKIKKSKGTGRSKKRRLCAKRFN